MILYCRLPKPLSEVMKATVKNVELAEEEEFLSRIPALFDSILEFGVTMKDNFDPSASLSSEDLSSKQRVLLKVCW